MSAPACPFSRPLYGPADPRHSAAGKDVLALKRALWRAGFFPGPASRFDGEYNQHAVGAVQDFQRYAIIKPTGNVGFATWEALRNTRKEGHPTEWAFDAYACKLAADAAAENQQTPTEKVQAAGVDAANYWMLHADVSAYGQVRPFPLVKPPDIARVTDCSGFVITVYFAAGAPDPSGYGFAGIGYTGSLVGRGVAVALDALEPLDLLFYGKTLVPSPAFPYGSPTHVAVYVGAGYVASDGSQSGPQKWPVAYRPVHSARRYPLV